MRVAVRGWAALPLATVAPGHVTGSAAVHEAGTPAMAAPAAHADRPAWPRRPARPALSRPPDPFLCVLRT